MFVLKIQGLPFSPSDDIGACMIGSALSTGYDFKRHILDIVYRWNHRCPIAKVR